MAYVFHAYATGFHNFPKVIVIDNFCNKIGIISRINTRIKKGVQIKRTKEDEEQISTSSASQRSKLTSGLYMKNYE